jgi:CP family cyanate transporter-like MFS transporter
MSRHAVTGFGLLWCAGLDVRLTLLAVPPVLPLIHRDLRLSETGIAALTGLPVFLLAAAAIPGSLLVARLGARRALLLGIALTGVASGLRGVGPSVAVLFGMTLLMGTGVAIAQPAIPALIGQWFPDDVGRATAVYVNGLLVGETLSASLTLPVVLPLASGRWEASFVLWAIPVVATGLLMAWLGPLLPDAAGSPAVRWWPDWDRGDTWRLGLLQGGASAAYFGANAFIPEFLRAMGRPQAIGGALAMLNAGQLPASLLALGLASSLVGRRFPFVVVSLGILGGLGVFLLGPSWAPAAGAGILGLCFAFVLILTLALPPVYAAPDDIHRLSAAMFAIGYLYSFVIPLLGGAAWDLARAPGAAFLPVVVGALTVLGAAAGLPPRGTGAGRGGGGREGGRSP